MLQTDSRVVLKFRPFIKDQLDSMRQLYAGWKFPFEGTKFLERLQADQQAQRDYKRVHKCVAEARAPALRTTDILSSPAPARAGTPTRRLKSSG